MEREVYVYLDLSGQPTLIGRLWEHVHGRRQSSSFAYHPTWLAHTDRFALEPGLTLDPGSHHSEVGRALFGSFADSSPDRWGRNLMRRAERQRAAAVGETPKALSALDFLLGVNGFARQGALRFASKPGGPFLADSGPQAIPPLIELPKLLAAADHSQTHAIPHQSLALLLAPGSSLGGARPKASVTAAQGNLAIATFPRSPIEKSLFGAPSHQVWQESSPPRSGLEIAVSGGAGGCYQGSPRLRTGVWGHGSGVQTCRKAEI